MITNDTYVIKSAEYDESADVLDVKAYLALSPNHDDVYISYEESPICFTISLNFSYNRASIISDSSDTFQSNVSYVPSVLHSFACEFERVYDAMSADSSPSDVFVTLKEFNVPF